MPTTLTIDNHGGGMSAGNVLQAAAVIAAGLIRPGASEAELREAARQAVQMARLIVETEFETRGEYFDRRVYGE